MKFPKIHTHAIPNPQFPLLRTREWVFSTPENYFVKSFPGFVAAVKKKL